MKIICNQKLLANKIGIVQKAINSKTTLDLLKGVLIVTKQDEIILKGYDLEIGIESHVPAEVIQEGSIVINSKLFGDIIRKLPDSFVEIETDEDNNVYINCLNSKFKIKGDSAKEYPQIPDVNEDKLYSIPQDVLKSMIKQTVFATSQDQTKPILMGELLEIENGNINLVAIDGYRFAVRSCQVDNLIHEDLKAKIIIPGKTLIDVNSLLSSEEEVKVGFNEKNAIFIINDTKIVTRLLEGEFIDYKKLCPREYNSKIKLKTKDGFSHSLKTFNEFDFEVKSNGSYRPSSSATFESIKSEDDDPHTSTLLITMEQEDINNSNIRLIFKDFGYSPYNKSKGEYEDFVSLIKGNWTLNFKLNCKDTSKTYIINKSYKVNNKKVRVKTVTLSPLSVRIKSNGKYNHFISKVTMKDGTEYSGDDFFISNTSSYSTIGRDLFGRSESYTSFSKILNPKDIKSITINDEIEVMMP